MELAHVVHRAATDPTFAAKLLHDPHATLQHAQAQLDQQQLAALLAFLREHPRWTALCSPGENPIQTGYWY
jgi:DNA-binding MurR/RpiR family transcriptional regulator